MIGILKDLPIFWIYNTSVIVLMMSFVGLNQLTDWRVKNRPQYKLSCVKGRVVRLLPRPKDSVEICLGLEFANSADFPIEFHVIDLYTRIINEAKGKEYLPPRRDLGDVRHVFTPHSRGFFRDDYIKVNDFVDGTLVGEVEATVHYGKEGNLKHVMNLKKRSSFYIQGNTMLETDWYDIT